MIGQAILNSEKQMMTLSEICNWITKVYPYYRREQKGWQVNNISIVKKNQILI